MGYEEGNDCNGEFLRPCSCGSYQRGKPEAGDYSPKEVPGQASNTYRKTND